MPAFPESPVCTEGGILFLEEYEALAAAIGSALKKFAPERTLRLAPSFPMAEKLAREAPPALLVVDFDPPLPGALDFFTRLRSELPDVRVLIIAAGMPDILRERRLPSAFEFIEKPFQLPAFGSTIQEMLESAGDESAFGRSGALRDLNLSDVLPLLCLDGGSCILKVTDSADDRAGMVYVVRGQIRHAATNDAEGMEALREMFAWEESDFALGETGTPSAPRTIEDPWPAVLRRMLGPVPSARRKRAIERPLSQFKPKLALAPTVTNVVKDGSKVVIIDDTETLLDFVAEMLAAADPRMQIVTATNATDGLAACVAHRPDLILVDYCLPDFNGDEVCRRLLARDETRAIPVIMMSGHVAQMAATAAGFENVVFTLAKPFLSAAMVDVVRKSLANPPQIKPRPATTEVKASALAPPVQTAPEIANGERKTSEKKPHSEPPAPTPIPPPPSAPASAVPCATATVGFEVPVSAIVAEPGPSAQVSLTPAHLATTRSDAVVVSLALEIISMQFSPALQITAIRARPSSMIVSMQVDGRAAPSLRLPEAAFEMDRVNLGGRGEIETMQLAPSGRRLEALIAGSAVAIGHCAVLPSNGSGALQLTPATTAPVPIQLLMAFDLAGVELSPTFSLSHLALKARGRKVRVILPGQSGNVGVIFESAHVLLNHSALISEILLDSVVS